MIFPALSPMGQSLRRRRGQWLGPYRSPSGATPDLVLDFETSQFGVAGRTTGSPITAGRLSHSAMDGGAAGLIVEPSRTNLVAKSVARAETWSPVGPVTLTTLSENAFGLLPGLRIVSAGAAWHRASPGNVTFTAGTTYVVQLWYRATASNSVKLTLYSSTTTPATNLELKGASGAIAAVLQNQGTVTNVQNQSLGGGLYRLSFAFSVVETVSAGWGFGSGSTTAGDEIVVHALQIEAAATPSSYIFADGATASRAADDIQVGVVGWGRAPEGCIAASVILSGVGSGLLTLMDGAGGTLECFSAASGEITLRHNSGGGLSTLGSGVVVAGAALVNIAFSWGQGQLGVSVNGSARASLLVSDLGPLTALAFKADSGFGPAVHKTLRHFPTSLGANDLQALSG
jgi:hypothetical protein